MARERSQLGWKTFLLLMAFALGIGGVCRFTDLAKKPMHTDEAILALKTKEFWNTGFFKYDPKDYHGPFLHHAAKIVSIAKGWTAETFNERESRWVIALFGMGILLLPLFLVDVLGRTGAFFASLLMAASPMMTYYSRYYIMEVPFVFLTGLLIISLWRWSQSRNYFWLFLGGVSLGFMHATKETFVLNLGAMFAGWLVVKIFGGSYTAKLDRYSFSEAKGGALVLAWFIIIPIAALTSVWMFSNNFKDWQGVLDSIFTYKSYLERSGGSGHEKDWTYYLTLFFWRKDGFIWTEAFMGVLALLGILNIFFDSKRPLHHRSWLSFLAVYTLVLLAGYSVIPYKTPWSVLAVSFGFALLGGVGVGALYRTFSHPFFKFLLTLVLAAGITQLLRQTSLATDYAFPGQTRYAADARNPYVYSHTSPNLVELSRRIHQIAKVSRDGLAMPVQIIQSEHGWPLPWYLRDMTHVGYQSEIPAKLDAAVIVMDLDKVDAVRNLLAEQQQVLVDGTFTRAVPSEAEPPPLGFPDIAIFPADASQPVPPLPPKPVIYQSSLNGLRPGTTLEVWIRKDLWDKLLEQESQLNARVRP